MAATLTSLAVGLQPSVASEVATEDYVPRPGIEAAFERESYRPGASATLRLWRRAATIQIFHLGTDLIAGLRRFIA